MPRALVAGAGVGGLSAALALGANGWRISIFERAKALSEFGAGLQLTPNATRALKALGAFEAVARRAFAPAAVVIRRGRDGATLVRAPLADAEARWGAPYLALHRADLQAGLLETVLRAGQTEIVLEREASGVAADGAEVVLGLKRGLLSLSERGDCVIAADGVWSKLRERLGLGGPNEATALGMTAFRASLPFDKAREAWRREEICLNLGPDAHLVHYPLPARNVVNLVGVVRAPPPAQPGSGYDATASGPEIAARFAGWNDDARAMLAAADTWRAWPMFDRPPVAAYAAGRIALVGDAAHPMAPFLAQGAAMAIEDGAALLGALRENEGVEAAFAAWSAGRAPRAGRVQTEARRQGAIYHHRGPMAFARDVALQMMGPRRLLGRYDWLYGA